MSWKFEKESGDIVISGFETGISPSPHKGTANIQNANLSTETGEVMASFARVQQSMTDTFISGTLTFVSSTNVSLNISGSNNAFNGQWITVTNSSHTGELANGTYYVTFQSTGTYILSSFYNGAAISGFTSGLTATITLAFKMSIPVASATETYFNGGITYYRYYVLDSVGLVWVYDSRFETASPSVKAWFLPDFSTTYFTANSSTLPTGIAVLDGWLLVFGGHQVFAKSTVNLGGTTSTSTTYNQVVVGASASTNVTITAPLVVGATSATLSTSWGGTTGTYTISFVGDSNDTQAVTLTNGSTGVTVAAIVGAGNITATGTLSTSATSATLTIAWGGTTGVYAITFSNGNTRTTTLNNGSTTISWSGGLSGSASATINVGTTATINVITSTSTDPLSMSTGLNSNNPHQAFVAYGDRCYYTDGRYLGLIFPNTSILVPGLQNVQSFCSYTATTTTGTVQQVISGSLPTNGYAVDNASFLRVPAVFFTAQADTQPSNLASGVVYYISIEPYTGIFNVYSSPTSITPINIASGASGTQYFNTFYPISGPATYSGISPTGTVQFSPQVLTLPSSEISQCLGQIGTQIIVGTNSKNVFAWNQTDLTANAGIQLPEDNCVTMVNVHNMMYLFAGNKGNIYITDGSVVSHVYQVPDFCAGIAGLPSSYIEPYFVWGGAMYLRGRVYFSILDQTTIKVGNCGGIWSFVPTQNYFIQQDVGISLVLENQNSYGTYNGYCPVLLSSQNQEGVSPQFWSGWIPTQSSANGGIDFTGTFPIAATKIETDLIPTGTMLQEQTFGQIEFKLSTPLLGTETVNIQWRVNATDAYQSTGADMQFNPQKTSGYFVPDFEFTQWIQLLITLTPNGTSTFSGNRLTELRIRQ